MYQALYRKWRPRTFDDVAGQAHITDTLKRQVSTGRLSHAYLFTGTRGTGKTTCAKLLARAANCEHPVDGSPCNQCPSCLGIENGSIMDVLELDAASNNRVDDIRAILDQAVYTPATVKRRVYIVDEVHMLTQQAYNALLQILEEPPAHLMFILATTEVHKVPATIKSRCQQFSFKRIQAPDIAARLSYVARQENINLTSDGAELIARLADGGMRDALSLLDQCSGERDLIDEAAIIDVLGLAGNVDAANLMNAVASGDTGDVLTRLDRLYSSGKEMAALLGELSTLARDLLIRKTAPNSGASLMTGGFDAAVLKQLGAKLSTPRLVHMLTTLQRSTADLARSANRRTDAELCLLALCDPALDSSAPALTARVAALEERLRSGVFVQQASAPEPVSKPEPEPTPEPEPEERTYDDDPPPWAWNDDDAPPLPEEYAPAPPDPEPEPEPQSEPEPQPESRPQPAPGCSWAVLRAKLEPVMNVADFCFVGNPDMVNGSIQGDTVTLWVENEFVKGFVDTQDILTLVARTAADLLGFPCRAVVQVGKAPPDEGYDALDDLIGLENVTVT